MIYSLQFNCMSSVSAGSIQPIVVPSRAQDISGNEAVLDPPDHFIHQLKNTNDICGFFVMEHNKSPARESQTHNKP